MRPRWVAALASIGATLAPTVDPAEVGRVADQGRRHLGDLEDQVDEAGGRSTPGHARMGRRRDVLRHGQAAVLLDRLDPDRALVAGAGQDDADRVLALVLGERDEEPVDHGLPLLRRHRHPHAQPAALDRERGVGRDDVEVVALDRHPVRGLQHRHLGVAAEQLREHARALGHQVLDQDEGHAAVRRQVLEEGLVGLEPARRGADADDQQRRSARVSSVRLGFVAGRSSLSAMICPHVERAAVTTPARFPKTTLDKRSTL